MNVVILIYLHKMCLYYRMVWYGCDNLIWNKYMILYTTYGSRVVIYNNIYDQNDFSLFLCCTIFGYNLPRFS